MIKMSNITTEKANELFWLGRYVERVYTTCMEFFRGYDRMIDEQEISYPEYCRRVSIPNVYADKEDFLRNYPFDDSNPDSIISNLIRAYDNAVVLRDDIGSDTLSYIQLAIYDMRKASLGVAPLIGLQTVIDDIFAFWGCLDDRVVDYSERSIVKAARRIERIDLYLRFGLPADKISGQDILRGQQAAEQDRQDRSELRPGRHPQAEEHAGPGGCPVRRRHPSHRVYGGCLRQR